LEGLSKLETYGALKIKLTVLSWRIGKIGIIEEFVLATTSWWRNSRSVGQFVQP